MAIFTKYTCIILLHDNFLVIIDQPLKGEKGLSSSVSLLKL